MRARVGLLLRALPPPTLLLLLLLLDCLEARLAQRGDPELRAEAEAFLEKYGYLTEQTAKAPASTRFSNAVREFQWVSQLPISGVLDQATLHQMTRPRCGVADTDSHSSWTERIRVLFPGRRAKMMRKKRFARPGTKWYKQHLSYRLVNWPEHLPESAVRGAVRAAFQVWSNVSALEFWEAPSTGPADIRLTFFQGDHNDGLDNAFDGPGAATKPPSIQQVGHPTRKGNLGVTVKHLFSLWCGQAIFPLKEPSSFSSVKWEQQSPEGAWHEKHFANPSI